MSKYKLVSYFIWLVFLLYMVKFTSNYLEKYWNYEIILIVEINPS